MHAQEVVELILKKAGEDVLKQIELAAAVKDRLTDVNPNKDLPVALAIVVSVKSWFIALWSPRDTTVRLLAAVGKQACTTCTQPRPVFVARAVDCITHSAVSVNPNRDSRQPWCGNWQHR